MKNYIQYDPWKIVESGFHPEYNEITESLMSLGNGRIGHRGSFEETYSGKTLLGNYVAGVYFPDKTRVGWWKNGYPNYFAKVLNSCNWIGIEIRIGGELLDLATCEIVSFSRELDMREGVLYRNFTAVLPESKIRVEVSARRFCSLVKDEAGAISYQIKLPDTDAIVEIIPYLDGAVRNRDSNYDESFWEELHKETGFAQGQLLLETKENPFGVERFQVASAMTFDLRLNELKFDFQSLPVKKEKYVAGNVKIDLRAGDVLDIYKYAATLSSMNYTRDTLVEESKKYVEEFASKGFAHRLAEHIEAWAERWRQNDIKIEGDISAQQGIRFNIFHLGQTYSGKDDRLNIGPKGFTGEKYGGSTYWDTEAYCIPFYLSTAPPTVARNLLIYRYRHLPKAIENAEKLGFDRGAALYPMVTMNGEECHNEWEITFEEIHRNGAIAYGIYDYIKYTGDTAYLSDYGLEVLIAISRFWLQRVNWSAHLQKYVMLGVTGPNEYENNVNNNWYTNYIARWTLQYCLESIDIVRKNTSDQLDAIFSKVNFKEEIETGQWKNVIRDIYLPYDDSRQVFLQQQGFLDKELLSVGEISSQRPINQNWSWDRILRSCFIKQADVLQGLYFFEEDFTIEEITRNFEFYEPMTVHESSLSPCVHSILASKIGNEEKAYEMYVRTARLDLDDYNNDTEDGLHITSMAGTWMSIVKGFAGQRVDNDRLVLNPTLPQQWEAYTFRIRFREVLLEITTKKSEVIIRNISDTSADVCVYRKTYTVESNAELWIGRNS